MSNKPIIINDLIKDTMTLLEFAELDNLFDDDCDLSFEEQAKNLYLYLLALKKLIAQWCIVLENLGILKNKE